MPHGFTPGDEPDPTAQKSHWDPFVQVRAIPIEGRGKSKGSWKPVSIRTPFLIAIIVITLALITLIQVITFQSERDGGLFFARRISELADIQTFLYLYLPTLIAVIYSLIWTWIDMDAKRAEPYRQLAKPGGARAKDSLLLHYPSDFLAMVPLKSLRKGHWPVFISSCSLVLVAWSITPLQSAIFATKTMTRSFNQSMQLESGHLSLAEQSKTMTANYTYSVFGIAWLGERLPPYMSRQAAFAPVQLSHMPDPQDDEQWTVNTTSYSLDMHCEEARLKNITEPDSFTNEPYTVARYASSQGCKVPPPFGPDGTDIVGHVSASSQGVDVVKEFTPFYAGNQNPDGLADYYLSMYCPSNATHVFMAAFARNRRAKTDAAGSVTRMFCEPTYYQQNVTAVLRREDLNVLRTIPKGPKQPLPPDLFNTSSFETQMVSAEQTNGVRGSVPSTQWPDQREQLGRFPVTINAVSSVDALVFGLAIGSYQRPAVEYLDPQTLANSYEAAYRLLFARAMVDVLKPRVSDPISSNGTRAYKSQAVYVVPGFAYAVEALLGAVALLALSLLIFAWHAGFGVASDPGSIVELMALVNERDDVLQDLQHHDRSSRKALIRDLSEQRYAIEVKYDQSRLKVYTVKQPPEAERLLKLDSNSNGEQVSDYPAELSWPVGLPFTISLAAVLATIAYFSIAARGIGLALPSPNRFVRQMLENYIPTIIATLIEPVWVVINRLMCTLQPFEELRKGDASAHRSIGLNYSSLPSQLVFFKAIRARHILLAVVCAMTLFANLLAVAFSGMFNEEPAPVPRDMNYTQGYLAKFGNNATASYGPENTTSGTGSTLDHFYVAMANLTSNTPMPAWTDDKLFYVPLSISNDANSSSSFQGPTTAFGTALECQEVKRDSTDDWTLTTGPGPWSVEPAGSLTITTHDDEIGKVTCSAGALNIAGLPMNCSDQASALEIITPVVASPKAPDKEQAACRKLIVAMWARSTAAKLCHEKSRMDLADANATVVACKPTIVAGGYNVTVAVDGMVHSSIAGKMDSNVTQYFESDPDELVVQAKNFLLPLGTSSIFFRGRGGRWHNDPYPSDWHSFLMNLMEPSAGLLDPTKDLPDAKVAGALFSRSYSKVFAIWLNQNYQRLLLPTEDAPITVQGVVSRDEVRIMVSRPMVFLSVAILSLYILVAAAVYFKRPGKFLPRLPTSMASCIAMFAASRALGDMSETIGLSRGESNAWLEAEKMTFGYGKFLGTDGKVHVGIERKPFVTPLG